MLHSLVENFHFANDELLAAFFASRFPSMDHNVTAVQLLTALECVVDVERFFSEGAHFRLNAAEFLQLGAFQNMPHRFW